MQFLLRLRIKKRRKKKKRGKSKTWGRLVLGQEAKQRKDLRLQSSSFENEPKDPPFRVEGKSIDFRDIKGKEPVTASSTENRCP